MKKVIIAVIFPIGDWKIFYAVSRKMASLNNFHFGNGSTTEEISAVG